MTDEGGRAQPGMTKRAEAARAGRERREAAALRENLRRRKASVRAAEAKAGEQTSANKNVQDLNSHEPEMDVDSAN